MTRRPIAEVWLALLVVLFVSTTAAAQGLRVRPGIEAGVTFARFAGDNLSGVENRTGAFGGVLLTIDLGRYLALEPGAMYSSEGSNLNLGPGLNGTIKADYIQLPLRLVLSAPPGSTRRLRPYVYAGPSLGLQVKCRVTVRSGGGVNSADCGHPSVPESDTKGTQVGVHVGAGLELGALVLGIRYQAGLTSIDDVPPRDKLTTRVLALSVGVRTRGRR